MNKKIKLFTLFIVLLIFTPLAFAGIIDSGWEDSRAYRPYPVLFLHGFAKGRPQSWTEAKVDEVFNQYYSKYYTGYNSDPTILPSTRYPYLEIIDFGSSLIDRNSSIDTYKTGDRYVQIGDRRAGDPGWSDKLNSAIESLRQGYINKDGSSQKIILVGHSMGGLAARKYLKSYSYANQKIEKLIMIGTPNLGSEWATTAVTYSRNRRLGWYDFPFGWVSSSSITTVDKILESTLFVDIDGDAVWDMDPTSNGSGFISELNTNYSQEVNHFAIAGKYWLDFNLGDGIVSLDSQLGNLSSQDIRTIYADHWTEPALATNDILYFLDSTPPELEITYPNPNQVTEIREPSMHIKGKVYKEYLPADSTLTITVIRQEDGYSLPPQTSSLKPSDLWIPNNPDSPVAEFDENIHFPDIGTYIIKVIVINATGSSSEPKEVKVRVRSWDPSVILKVSIGPFGGDKTIHRRPLIEAWILSLSGIDWDSLIFTLDGSPVAPSIDKEMYYVSYRPSSDLSYANHTVVVKVKNTLGKESNEAIKIFEVKKLLELWNQAVVGFKPEGGYFTSEGGSYYRRYDYKNGYHDSYTASVEITPELNLRLAYEEFSDNDNLYGLSVIARRIPQETLEPNTYLTFTVLGSLIAGSRYHSSGVYLIVYAAGLFVDGGSIAVVYVFQNEGAFEYPWGFPNRYKKIYLGNSGSYKRNLFDDFSMALGRTPADLYLLHLEFYIYSDGDTVSATWDDISLYQDNSGG